MIDNNNYQPAKDSDNIEKKDQALFDDIASKFAEKDRIKSTSIARRYQLMFAVSPILKRLVTVDTIVDVACGVGAPAVYLDGLYKTYIGVDHSKEMIKAAEILCHDKPNARFITSNIKKVEIPENTADIILAVGALHHMTKLDEVMNSLRHIAKPRAYFVAIEPQRGNSIVQILRGLRTKTDSSYSPQQRYFNKSELHNLMINNGMSDIEIEYQGYFSPPFAQVVLRPQFITVPLSHLVVSLDKVLDKCLPSFLKILSWNIVVRCRFS